MDTEPGNGYNQWVRDAGIKRRRVDIAPNKDGKIKTTWDSLCEALLVMLDASNYPLYIHCNQGRHRTGCIVACLRRIQRWPLDDILTEYEAYASPKARPGDKDLIRTFDPAVVFDYAQRHGYLDDRPFMRRMDSTIIDIDGLAQALSLNGCSTSADDWPMDLSTISTSSVAADDDDGGMEMKFADTGSDGRRLPGHGPVVAVNHGATEDEPMSGEGGPVCDTSLDDNAGDQTAWDGDTATTVMEVSED